MADATKLETIVKPAGEDDRTLIAGLMQKYLSEISPHTGQSAQGNGRYRYPGLPAYWLEEHRHPFVIRAGRKTAGFALAKAVPGGMTIVEFYVVPDLRHVGHGRAAAEQVFARFPGKWAVRELLTHADAQTFWRSVIRNVDSHYSERVETSKDGRSWTVQRFKVR